MGASSCGFRATRQIISLSLVGLAVVGLAGCSQTDHQLPSLGGEPAAATNDLVTIAKTYYDCMHDADINVSLVENYDGALTVVSFSEEDEVLAIANGSIYSDMAGEVVWTEEQTKLSEQFFADAGDGPALMINGVDLSETYVRCLTESGYDELNAWGEQDYAMDAELVALQIESNNQWAACARANGWPSVADSVMPTDLTNSAWPTIELPNTITEDQLRQLVAACPTFDANQAKLIDEYLQASPTATDIPKDYLPDPAIDIIFPEIFEASDSETTTPEQEAAMERYTILMEILWQASNDYYDAQYGDDLTEEVSAAASAEASAS